MRTIAHWMLASKQLMDDGPAMMSLIDGELRYGLALVEGDQLLNGPGTGTDLTGLYTGVTAFSAPIDVTSPTMIDVLLQAIAQVERLAFVVKHPDAFVKGDFSDQIGE